MYIFGVLFATWVQRNSAGGGKSHRCRRIQRCCCSSGLRGRKTWELWDLTSTRTNLPAAMCSCWGRSSSPAQSNVAAFTARHQPNHSLPSHGHLITLEARQRACGWAKKCMPSEIRALALWRVTLGPSGPFCMQPALGCFGWSFCQHARFGLDHTLTKVRDLGISGCAFDRGEDRRRATMLSCY